MASKTLRELTIKLDTDVAQLKKGLASANKKLTKFQKGVGSLGTSLKNAFSIAAIAVVGKQLIDMAGEMSMLGKELEGVKAGFSGIDPMILEDMKKATHGTVTELNLMKAAVQAKNFELPVEKLGTMLEFVHRRARASGESVDFLTKSLVTGLGRKSAMIIDNLGISTSQLNAQLKLTPDFTEAVAEIMKRDMAAAGQYIETAADITERWGADWENTKAQVGLFINKGIKLIAPVIDDLKKSFSEWTTQSSKELLFFTNQWITLYNESILFRGVLAAIGVAFTVLWEGIKLAINLIIDAVKGAGSVIAFALNPKNWGRGFADGMEEVMDGMYGEMGDDAVKAGSNIGTSMLTGLDKTLNGQKELITFDDMVSPEAQTEIVKKAKDLGGKVGNAITSNMAAFQKNMKSTFANDGGTGEESFFPDIESEGEEFVQGLTDVTGNVKVAMDSVNNFLAESFAKLGENIGKSLVGMGGLFDGFLSILLDFGKQFGKILIAVGVAKVSLEKIGISGIGAIIAGTALIAAMSAAQSLISKGPGFAGGGIVGGSSMSGDKVPIRVNSGELILNAAQQGNVASKLGGGMRNGQIVSRMAGSDILFIWEEANRQNNNSF